MSTSEEHLISTESVRTPRLRDHVGALGALGASIRDEGMRHPVTLWKDGTLISGARRHRTALLAGASHIQAVFVDTIEDAAKNLLRDNEDDYLALPWKWTEVCRLWELLRRLDEPAAAIRTDQARRRGVELRRQTTSGKRKPGRDANHSEDYALTVLSGPFGVSYSTAKRLWAVYGLAYGTTEATNERREDAREAMRNIDAGESSIYANYSRLTSDRIAPVSRPRRVEPVEAAPAARQAAAWAKSLPQMEGLVAGLTELGPPNAELSWEQIGPTYTRLMAVRRELEKIIKQMRESNKS